MIRLVQTVFAALMLTSVHLSCADESRKPVIGLVVPVDASTDAPFRKAFLDGLQELGYVDGKNVVLVTRYSNGDPAKLREIIRELVALKVDVLTGDAPTLKNATTTIPIVSATMGDPVRTGLVASLARPGGNLTGLSYQRYDTDPKLLELTKELLPGIKRICVLFDDDRERNLGRYINSEFRALADNVAVSICTIPVRTVEDIRAIPRAIDKERAQATVTWASAFTYQHREALIGSIARRLPVIADGRELTEAGAVLSYSVDWLDMFRRSAGYVDRILKGAKPAELPIEQPTKFKLVVNLKAAKALKITVPETIIVRADEIIR